MKEMLVSKKDTGVYDKELSGEDSLYQERLEAYWFVTRGDTDECSFD